MCLNKLFYHRERQSTSWTVILERMIGNVVISEVDALTYVVLNRAEKQVPYGELVCTTDSIILQSRCRRNRGRYNRVQLYLVVYFPNLRLKY